VTSRRGFPFVSLTLSWRYFVCSLPATPKDNFIAPLSFPRSASRAAKGSVWGLYKIVICLLSLSLTLEFQADRIADNAMTTPILHARELSSFVFSFTPFHAHIFGTTNNRRGEYRPSNGRSVSREFFGRTERSASVLLRDLAERSSVLAFPGTRQAERELRSRRIPLPHRIVYFFFFIIRFQAKGNERRRVCMWILRR
jgi:hypothetical protein